MSVNIILRGRNVQHDPLSLAAKKPCVAAMPLKFPSTKCNLSIQTEVEVEHRRLLEISSVGLYCTNINTIDLNLNEADMLRSF